jgi:DNA topoisomerase I
MTTLVIVESPNKIKKLQEHLGNDYKVLASVGHVRDLSKGGNHGIGIDIEKGFKPHYILLPDKIAVIDNIINAAAEATEILLATDFDREGEAIAYSLAELLKSTQKPMFRIEFNEITHTGVQKGIANKHAIDMAMVRSQEARRMLDRIVGFTVSPFLMTSYNQSGLSGGRVQSVATELIVDREKEITVFRPEEYWTLGVKLTNENHETFVAKYDGKLKNQVDTEKLVKLIEADTHFLVGKVQKQDKKDKPPAPLITASLQQIMAKRGFSPEQTMNAAQSLYESGMITYHRTDATRIAEEAVEQVRSWIKKAGYELPRTKNVYASKSSAQEAHEAIRPTNINAQIDNGYSSMSNDEKEVYDTVRRYFIASQMIPATWNTLNVKIALKSNPKIIFKATGKALADPGFLAIFGGVDPGKIEIPNLVEGQELTLADEKSIKAEQKFTQPPPRYNDASLLKELENKGIGRPSTFADICKKIANRHYVEKQGNTYRPTDLGKEITNYLAGKFSFMEYGFTAAVEQELDKIAEGKITHLDLLGKFYQVFSAELFKAYREKLGDNNLCPKCSKNMLARDGKYGKFFACINPACRHNQNLKAA